MPTIEKYQTVNREFVFDYEAVDGKILADIVEAVYMLTIEREDADDAYMLKRRTVAGVSVNDASKVWTVNIIDSDYDNIVEGKSYKEIFGIKYTGDTRFRTYPLMDANGTQQSELTIKKPWFQITS
jgi:hypothetical protein